MLSRGRQDYRDLPTRIASSVGKEAVVVAPGTRRAHGDFLDAHLRRVLGYEGSEIDISRARRGLPGELLPYLGADLITTAANRRAEVHGELVWCQAVPRQSRDSLSRNSRCGASPSRVEQRDDAGGVRDEYRDAIRDADSQCYSLLRGDVTIGLLAGPKPSLPAAGVHEHTRSMYLPDRDQPSRALP